jgi:Transposase DDE domain
MHLFEGNKAETKTLIPVLAGFRAQHAETQNIVVVADAGMLPAANLLAVEEAGFRFIVGSKVSKAPYDLPSTSNGTATPSMTDRRSRPAVSRARVRTPGPAVWSTTGRSSGIATTTSHQRDARARRGCR